MGNSWSLDLHVDGARFADAVARFVGVVQSHGYDMPADGSPILFYDGSGDELTLSATEALERMATAGGGTAFFKADDDLFVCTSPSDALLSVSISHDLHRGSRDDENKAADVVSILRSAVEELAPVFAEFVDEWTVEGRLEKSPLRDPLRDDVRARQPPSELAWLTYFTEPYFAVVEPLLRRVACRTERTTFGTLVWLDEGPWSQTVATRSLWGGYAKRVI